jgi:hypothetical protein
MRLNAKSGSTGGNVGVDDGDGDGPIDGEREGKSEANADGPREGLAEGSRSEGLNDGKELGEMDGKLMPPGSASFEAEVPPRLRLSSLLFGTKIATGMTTMMMTTRPTAVPTKAF